MIQTFNLKAAINLRSAGAVCLSKAAQLTAAGIARPDIFWIKILSKFDFSFFDTSHTASTMLEKVSDVWSFQKITPTVYPCEKDTSSIYILAVLLVGLRICHSEESLE